MDKKLHIKAIANHNVKVDAYHYKYGDEFDCWITPQYFKDLILSDALLDFDIILDDSSPKSIDAEFKVLKEEKEEVKEDVKIQRPEKNEDSTVAKSPKKTRS